MKALPGNKKQNKFISVNKSNSSNVHNGPKFLAPTDSSIWMTDASHHGRRIIKSNFNNDKKQKTERQCII